MGTRRASPFDWAAPKPAVTPAPNDILGPRGGEPLVYDLCVSCHLVK
jgi:hypothetical protein